MKRFYREVSVSADLAVLLDARPIKTPAKAPLVLSNVVMAEAVADEWRKQGAEIRPQLMPITGLANAVIDRVAPDADAFAASLAAYAESDLLCYRAEEPFDLVARQNQDWNPLLGWAQVRYDVSFTLVRGIMHRPQPEATLNRLRAAVRARSSWELAALNPLVTISGSIIVALAVLEREIDPNAAFDTAHLDELWQAEQWGEDDFALEARALHRRDFCAAARFLDLLCN